MNAPLPDWRSDWLYALILREAEEDWRHCGRTSDRKVWQYVLIEEWSSAHHRPSQVAGKVRRAWVRDAEGLREITLEEYKQHKRRVRGPVYPFILLEFYIHPDRQHVVMGSQMASRFAQGGAYLVQGQGDEAELVRDPQGQAWIS